MRVYLDSSAITKRYIKEIGSNSLNFLYHELENLSQVDQLSQVPKVCRYWIPMKIEEFLDRTFKNISINFELLERAG